MEKQYNFKETETRIAQQWAINKIYDPTSSSGPLFSIDTPPPTVSGSLHIGHIFSYTQTDIIARYKRMQGHRVYYPFGFDDNGLATERYVEKECKIQAHQLPRQEFIKRCLEQTQIAEKQFQDLWERMGLSIDWRYWYSTISDQTRTLAQASFIDLYHKGYVYRSHDPALYCSTCRTAIAQAELDDKELPSVFYDIVFRDSAGQNMTVGTTRPELLFSCVALLYHPSDTRYQHLRDTQARVPVTNALVPVIADEAVIPEKGTGLVMCCTFGDKTDIAWFKKFKFPYKQSIGRDGKFTKDAGFLQGMNVSDARTAIVNALKERESLTRERQITHAVSVHERCKKEVEFLILPQWFVKILPHKQTFIDCADQISWYPSFMKARYIDWVRNLQWDWCISRQRSFGIPFPVWHCTSCQQVLFASPEQLPVDPREQHGPKACNNCQSTAIEPDTDVMDTWNTSSITPYIVQQLLDPKISYFSQTYASVFEPMSMRPQAHDIIRTWAFYTIVKSWMHSKTIPWHNIVISGHVLAGDKEKISKSQGNASMEPRTLLAQYPADAIRFWTASGNLGHDITFSDAQIRIGYKLITKLWNAFLFINTHAQEFRVLNSTPPTSLGSVNEWILNEARHCFARYDDYFKQYEFGLALTALEQFFWKDFCDLYVEIIKHQLFNENDYQAHDVHATRWTLCYVGWSILQRYAPYVPYVTDAIYQETYVHVYKLKSIHVTPFASLDAHVYPHAGSAMHTLRTLIAQVRKLKSEQKLSLNTPLATLTVVAAHEDAIATVVAHERLVRGITHAQQIRCTQGSTVEPQLIDTDGAWQVTVFIDHVPTP